MVWTRLTITTMRRSTVHMISGKVFWWPYWMAKLPKPPAPMAPAMAVKLIRETRVMVTPRAMPGVAYFR